MTLKFNLFQLMVRNTLAKCLLIHRICVVNHCMVSLHIFSPVLNATQARTGHCEEFALDAMQGAAGC